MFLEAVIENLFNFWFYIVLCFVSIFNHVHMDRFVVIGIKLENKSEYDEDCWHNSLQFFLQT